MRIREERGPSNETFYDYIANMIFAVIFHASAVISPRWECWLIQHNLVWAGLFNFHHLDSPAGKVIKFKLRRLLYNEVVRMRHFPNFKGAKILGYCLNVMGFETSGADHYKDNRALHKAILAWTKKNYAWLHADSPRVAEACLVDGITYDVENLRLVKTYPAEGIRGEAQDVYLNLDPAPKKATE